MKFLHAKFQYNEKKYQTMNVAYQKCNTLHTQRTSKLLNYQNLFFSDPKKLYSRNMFFI